MTDIDWMKLVIAFIIAVAGFLAGRTYEWEKYMEMTKEERMTVRAEYWLEETVLDAKIVNGVWWVQLVSGWKCLGEALEEKHNAATK